MITEKRLEDALKFLSETDEQNAEANANVKYLDYLKERKHYISLVKRVLKAYLPKNKHSMQAILIKMLLKNYFKQRLKQVRLKIKEIKKVL